jgi:TolB-like protein/DNA-binding winged helix-turn-helix (wHTH) protein/tetratricopeptide (TPR) repeat protein
MPNSTRSGRRISTGLFEVDLVSGEILREGRRVALQEQPFRVLSLLLEHPGQVVTREQMQASLWPADTYVGFDEGLNTAIRKLRVLFGDSADNPRFIETIPRRGYRFIAPVKELHEGEPLLVQNSVHTAASLSALESADMTAAQNNIKRVGHRRESSQRTILRRSAWGVSAALGVLVLFFAASALLSRRFHPSSAVTPPRRAMLVALPFQNLTNDPAQEYFSDGLTEETITDLGQLTAAQLGVIARTSAMAYKHTDKTVAQIGRELGVDYILEGSVRRENGRTRVSAQLIRVSDQTHLWAENYDARDLTDLIEVQNAIGRAIAQAVQINITPNARAGLSPPHPVKPEAYDLYLKGRFYWNQRTPAATRESIRLFQQAISLDPGFAEAYAGLARAYDVSNIDGIYSPKDSFPQAKAAAEKAIELDPANAEAYALLGMEKSHYEFDFAAAKADFLKAIELNPNLAFAHFLYSNCYLMPMGLREEAITENQKAIELDPLSLPINNFLGENYLLAGDYATSRRSFEHAMAMDPNFPLPHAYISGLFEVMGKYEEAIDERERGDLLMGYGQKVESVRTARLRNALRTGGEKAYWKEHLAQDIQAMGRPGVVFSPTVVAADYAQGGEKEKALQWLEKAYLAREGQELTLLAVDPIWKNLDGDPRFSDLLKRIGLPGPHR